MMRVKIGEPRATGARKCVEHPPGSSFWWEEMEQDYQDFDDNGQPMTPVYKETYWVITSEPCESGA